MTKPTKKLLILGGTGDAVRLAANATARGFIVISSLAGRTHQSRQEQSGTAHLRVGGFGGVSGLLSYLQQEKIDLVIDATHPFAQQISWNAAAAAEQCGIPRLLLHRPGWEAVAGDRWLVVPNQAAAAALLPGLAQRIFLTIGRQEISHYAHLSELWFLMRSIDPPAAPLPPGDVLLAKGPFTVTAEKNLLLQHHIEVIVSKNSGGSATYAKIVAARELNLPIVMIQRPTMPDGLQVTTVEEAVRWLEQML
jgi:precorrin-6A/cobalt-precorrin-6A reductase